MTTQNSYRTTAANGGIRRWGVAALLALMLAVSLPVSATRVNATSGMTLAGAPLAIHGYDPVAYHLAAMPVQGSASALEHTWVVDAPAEVASASGREAS